MKKKMVIWGAGRIGRGFVADLFFAAGYEIVFVDANEKLISAMNERKKYTVLKYKNDTDKTKSFIEEYTALHTEEKDRILSEMMDCEIMALAVFPEIFGQAAVDMVSIIQRRIENKVSKPLDIILCANIFNPSVKLDDIIRPMLGEKERQYFDDYIGLIDSLVIRMAVAPTDDMVKDDLLVVLTNGYEEITLDETSFKGGAPKFEGVVLTDNIHAEKMRKMYTYNMLHALYSYLGFQKGYEYVEDCTKDAEIQQSAVGALGEVAEALMKEFGFSKEDMGKWNSRVLENMANPILMDKVERVGADPIRKLKKQDRLTGPVLLCKNNGVLPYYLTKAIANGFLFGNKADGNTMIVKEYAQYYGAKAAAQKYCELESEPEMLEMIETHYQRAQQKVQEDVEKITLMKKAYGLGFKNEKVFKGCAQSAILAFFELTDKKDDMLFQCASSFSGGMAISGDGVCGGYSGGLMYMGSLVGRKIEEMKLNGDKEAQYTSYTMAQELRDRFIKTYGSVVCCSIHKQIFDKDYCLRTKAIRNEFEEAGAHTDKCTNVVGMSCAWIAEILYNYGYLK